MGLDMYLTAKYHYGGKWKEPGQHNEGHTLEISGEFVTKNKLTVGKVQEIIEEVAYWRKANQIHGWFVKNCQDSFDNCNEYYVSREQLQELHDLCKQVEICLKTKDYEKAEKLLPPTGGFFFGDTDINEWYEKDILDTIEQISLILEDKEKQCSYYYQSSW